MRKPTDIKLAGLAKQLAALSFVTPALPEHTTEAHLTKIQNAYNQNRLKGVNILLGRDCRSTVFVRSYVGAKYRTFATYGNDYFSAARLADLFTFRIGAARLSTPRPVLESDYNHSRAQAEADFGNEAAIVDIVLQIEVHLKNVGALFDPQSPVKSKSASVDEKLDAILAKLNSIALAL